MVRILLSLAVAAAAYFGPWFAETSYGAHTGNTERVLAGDYYAGAPVTCALRKKPSLSDECEPGQGTEGLLVTATVGLGLLSAALNVFGLLPFVGRATSVIAIVAGFTGIAAFGLVSMGVLGTEGMGVANLRWGAVATGVFGLLLLIAGVSGVRGDERS